MMDIVNLTGEAALIVDFSHFIERESTAQIDNAQEFVASKLKSLDSNPFLLNSGGWMFPLNLLPLICTLEL